MRWYVWRWSPSLEDFEPIKNYATKEAADLFVAAEEKVCGKKFCGAVLEGLPGSYFGADHCMMKGNTFAAPLPEETARAIGYRS